LKKVFARKNLVQLVFCRIALFEDSIPKKLNPPLLPP
jgi:hypothetical protein